MAGRLFLHKWPAMRSFDVFFYYCNPEQNVQQTVELPVILDTMTLILLCAFTFRYRIPWVCRNPSYPVSRRCSVSPAMPPLEAASWTSCEPSRARAWTTDLWTARQLRAWTWLTRCGAWTWVRSIRCSRRTVQTPIPLRRQRNSTGTQQVSSGLLWPGISFINSSSFSAAYMRQCIRSTLTQIMACRLFGAKPLSKPILGYCQLDL